MFNLNESMNYYLCPMPTDMRKSFYTLSGVVADYMQHNVKDGDVFIFVNRTCTSMKILHMLDEARVVRHIPSGLRDERSLRYMRLCGETLRKGESFAQAAKAYALPALSPASGHGAVAAAAEQNEAGREQRYNELVRRHAALRVQLTELYNENYEMRGAQVPLEELVDAGSIEHALQEINVYYGRAD